jgi:hypothetical protein
MMMIMILITQKNFNMLYPMIFLLQQGKLAKPRMLHCTHWGMICPAETPEGRTTTLYMNYMYVMFCMYIIFIVELIFYIQ